MSVVRKRVEETMVVKGSREDWLNMCTEGMKRRGFTRVMCSETLYQVSGDWKPLIGVPRGDVQVTLLPEGDDMTRMQITATGEVDISALFGSPGKRLIAKFKSGIEGVTMTDPRTEPRPPYPPAPVSSSTERS